MGNTSLLIRIGKRGSLLAGTQILKQWTADELSSMVLLFVLILILRQDAPIPSRRPVDHAVKRHNMEHQLT